MYQGVRKVIRHEYQNIEYSLLYILDASSGTLNRSEAEEVRHFVDYGEYGIALETLCAIIEEENREISPELYKRIRELGERMGLNSEVWKCLEGYLTDQGESGFC